MNEDRSAPMSHWLISGAGLIWNLFGLWIYVNTVSATSEKLAEQYTAAEIDFLQSIPAWATSANAIAVTTGVIGCGLLLWRKTAAVPLFMISLVALIVQDLYSFAIADVTSVFGMVPVYIQATVFVIGVALLLYARAARRKGILQ